MLMMLAVRNPTFSKPQNDPADAHDAGLPLAGNAVEKPRPADAHDAGHVCRQTQPNDQLMLMMLASAGPLFVEPNMSS